MYRQYVVDALTDRIFTGSPAAVCLVEQYPPKEQMPRIARLYSIRELVMEDNP